MHAPDRLTIPGEVLAIARRLAEAGHAVWCVGGAVRDALLGNPHADVDLATSAVPSEVQRLFRRTVPIGIEHGTVGVLDRHGHLHEVTTFRRDVTTDGRHATVAFGVSLDDDLARRDFTINAIAYQPLTGAWYDPQGGREDLSRGLLRAVGEPGQRFREDYLRILRGIRFAARFGFVIDDATCAAMTREAGGLAHLSAERVRDEWFKGVSTAQTLGALLQLWDDVGARATWLAGVRLPDPGLDAPGRLAPPRDPVLVTALLADDAAAVLTRLKAAGREIRRAALAQQAPHAPADATAVQVRRWLAEAGEAAEDRLLLATWRAGARPAWGDVLGGIRARGEATTRGALAVTGADLLALGIAAGPALGATLDRLLDAVLEDPARNTRGALLALARAHAGAA